MSRPRKIALVAGFRELKRGVAEVLGFFGACAYALFLFLLGRWPQAPLRSDAEPPGAPRRR